MLERALKDAIKPARKIKKEVSNVLERTTVGRALGLQRVRKLGRCMRAKRKKVEGRPDICGGTTVCSSKQLPGIIVRTLERTGTHYRTLKGTLEKKLLVEGRRKSQQCAAVGSMLKLQWARTLESAIGHWNPL